MGYSCRTLLRDTLVRHSSGHCCGTLLWDTLPAPQKLRVLKLYQFSASSSPDTPRTKVVLQSRQCSPAFRALDAHDLRRGLRGRQTNRRLACISRARRARSPQRVGGHRTNRTLACISRARHARSPQRVARAPDKSHSRLHFVHSTRAISAEGCAGAGQIALSPAFRALDTRDLRRGLRGHWTNRTLPCISFARHARSPQRVARAWNKSHSGLPFAHSTSAISAEGCASSLQNERFVRDVLKNSHVKVCKASVSYETSSKSQAETHANPNVTATFASTTTHNLTIPCTCHESFRVHTSNARKVLRLPRNVTSVTPRNLTIPCACHENRTSTPQSPHKVLRLPRKVTISSHVSFNKICTTPHVWNDFDPF